MELALLLVPVILWWLAKYFWNRLEAWFDMLVVLALVVAVGALILFA